jgi:hypothetical protein
MIPLPAFIKPEAWAGFVEMRRAMPKTRPFTVRAATLILYELQRIKDAGHCPNAALDQSTLHGWTDVYAPKDKVIERAPKSAAETTSRELDSYRLTEAEMVASREAKARVMANLRPAMRRVA